MLLKNDKITLGEFQSLIDIEVTPTVHAHPIHAHSQDGTKHWYVCSKCGKAVDSYDIFCKWCGAKMDEGGGLINMREVAKEEEVEMLNNYIESAVKEVKPVVHAHWIVTKSELRWMFLCSNCRKSLHTNDECKDIGFKYCPDCGATMDEAETDGY